MTWQDTNSRAPRVEQFELICARALLGHVHTETT